MKAMLKTKYNNIKPNDFNSSISFELSFCGTTLYSEDSFHVDFIDVDTRIFECVSNYPIDYYLYKGIKITTNFDSKKMILDCVKERKEQNKIIEENKKNEEDWRLKSIEEQKRIDKEREVINKDFISNLSKEELIIYNSPWKDCDGSYSYLEVPYEE